MKDDLEWAKRFVEQRSWVLHVDTRTVGQVAELFDAEGNPYTPPGQDKPLRDPVLRLEQGHTFVARAGAFIEFTAREAQFFRDAQGILARACHEMAVQGGKLNVVAQSGALLMAAALRAQLREIERLHPGVAPGPGPGGSAA